ncbi:hypothetical protein D3C84_1145320 [compost metagenome]
MANQIDTHTQLGQLAAQMTKRNCIAFNIARHPDHHHRAAVDSHTPLIGQSRHQGCGQTPFKTFRIQICL